jgi:hypothetical protein
MDKEDIFRSQKNILLVIVVLMIMTLSCSESDQAPIKTAAVQLGQTSVAEGKRYVETQAPKLKETADVVIKTQAEQLKETMQASIGTEVVKIESTLNPERFHATLGPPYDACVGKSTNITSPSVNDDKIIEKGFGNAAYSCDAKRGAINNTILLFGGKNGSILESPNYTADVSGGMEFDFNPSFTGNLKIDVTLSVTSKTGASAGSATVLPEFRDLILIFLPYHIGEFIDIANSLVFETAAGIKTSAYIYVDIADAHYETESLIGNQGFGASFPLPPHSQSAEYSDESVTISFTTPVNEGQKAFIGTGIKTTALVHGWAVAYWNPGKKQEVLVLSVELTENN